MIDGGHPLIRENLADADPPPSNDFQYIFARSASAVTASKKVQLTLKFTTRFPMSLR